LTDATSCQGFEDLAQRNHVRNRRTLYRWRRALGPSLRVVPSFTLERLGLSHAHLVITNPAPAWLRFPYALEHAWLTNDFLENQLYLHCIVPTAHKAEVRGLVRECQDAGWCTKATLSWTGSGWQELPDATTTNGPGAVPATTDAGLLREYPLVVPAICEAWNRPQSLSSVWAGIKEHVGDRLRSYVPRGRIYAVNGKAHVRTAYELLNNRGLFRQHVIRYDAWLHDAIEVFVFLRHGDEWLAEIVEAVRPGSAAIETYNGGEGRALVRVTGHDDTLRTILGLQDECRRHGATLYLRSPHLKENALVRFCYEFLFDPRTGTWVFPHDEIIKHMRAT
jgi:hypothetical protein